MQNFIKCYLLFLGYLNISPPCVDFVGIVCGLSICYGVLCVFEAWDKASDLITSVTVQSLRLMRLGANVFC